jgi:hypothetical protein
MQPNNVHRNTKNKAHGTAKTSSAMVNIKKTDAERKSCNAQKQSTRYKYKYNDTTIQGWTKGEEVGRRIN